MMHYIEAQSLLQRNPLLSPKLEKKFRPHLDDTKC
jgi:hypothetical protein